jgi:ubiquitin-protein ligase
MSSHCLKRIGREVLDMPRYQSNQWVAKPAGGYDLLNWEATIQNLDDPRHRGKTYRLTIEIPGNYPFVAPKVRFIDRVQCENVFYDGEICIDILKEAWSPAYTLWTLLEAISSVLTDKPISGLVNKVRSVSEVIENNMISNTIIREPAEQVQRRQNLQTSQQVSISRRRRRTEVELLMS